MSISLARVNGESIFSAVGQMDGPKK